MNGWSCDATWRGRCVATALATQASRSGCPRFAERPKRKPAEGRLVSVRSLSFWFGHNVLDDFRSRLLDAFKRLSERVGIAVIKLDVVGG